MENKNKNIGGNNAQDMSAQKQCNMYRICTVPWKIWTGKFNL
jgi:hypothetical protein